MSLEEFINELELKEIHNFNYCYYHAFLYDHASFIRMLNEGIKSKILLRQKGTGYNGLFYVSLSKDINGFPSAYNLLKNNPAFIIDGNLKTIKTRNIAKDKEYPLCLCNTFLPFRESAYEDEYQRFLIVPAKRIKALRYELLSAQNHQELKNKLIILQQIMKDLDAEENNMLVIDSDTHRPFNRKKILQLNLPK